MPGPKKSSPKKIKIAEDTAKALDLRRAGLDLKEIGKRLGRSRSWVSAAIVKWCETHPVEKLHQYRPIEIARQEAIIAAHWGKMGCPKSAKVIQDSSKILIMIQGAAAPISADLTATMSITETAHDALLSNLARLASAGGKGEGDPQTGESGSAGSPLHVAGVLGPAKPGSA